MSPGYPGVFLFALLVGCSTTHDLPSLEDEPPATRFVLYGADPVEIEVRVYADDLEVDEGRSLSTAPGRLAGGGKGFLKGTLMFFYPPAWQAGPAVVALPFVGAYAGVAEGGVVCGLDLSQDPFDALAERIGIAPFQKGLGLGPGPDKESFGPGAEARRYVLAVDEVGLEFARTSECVPIVSAYAEWYLGDQAHQQDCRAIVTTLALEPRPTSYQEWWSHPSSRDAAIEDLLARLGQRLKQQALAGPHELTCR